MNFAPGETSGDEGAALFHAIRGVDPAMPVLLMTAFTSLERAVSLVKAGATDYFGKPWDDARLVASVRELLAMREARRSSDRSGNASTESAARGRPGGTSRTSAGWCSRATPWRGSWTSRCTSRRPMCRC